jgi:hypothetical protein
MKHASTVPMDPPILDWTAVRLVDGHGKNASHSMWLISPDALQAARDSQPPLLRMPCHPEKIADMIADHLKIAFSTAYPSDTACHFYVDVYEK